MVSLYESLHEKIIAMSFFFYNSGGKTDGQLKTGGHLIKITDHIKNRHPQDLPRLFIKLVVKQAAIWIADDRWI